MLCSSFSVQALCRITQVVTYRVYWLRIVVTAECRELHEGEFRVLVKS